MQMENYDQSKTYPLENCNYQKTTPILRIAVASPDFKKLCAVFIVINKQNLFQLLPIKNQFFFD